MADIDLLFGVAGGGDVAGESGSLIKSQLESIIKGVEPLKIKVGIDVEASKKGFATDVESLFKGASKSIKLKFDTPNIGKALSGAEGELKGVTSAGKTMEGSLESAANAANKVDEQIEKAKSAIDKYYKALYSIRTSYSDVVEEMKDGKIVFKSISGECQDVADDANRLSQELSDLRQSMSDWDRESRKLVTGYAWNAEKQFNADMIDYYKGSVQDATRIVEEHFKARMKLARTKTDIEQQSSKYVSQDIGPDTVHDMYGGLGGAIQGDFVSLNHHWDTLAGTLNRTTYAYGMLESIMEGLPLSDQADIKALIIKREKELAQAIEDRANADRKAAEAAGARDKKRVASNAARAEREELLKSKKIIDEYYSARLDLDKEGSRASTDIYVNADGLLESASGRYTELCGILNRTSAAYNELKRSMLFMSDTNVSELRKKDIDAENAYNIELEKRRNIQLKLKESDKSKFDKESALKAEADAYEKAENAIIDFYKAQRDVVKKNADIDIYDDGKYYSLSGEYTELAERLNRTQEAFVGVERVMKSMTPENRAKITQLLISETNELNEAIENQVRQESAAAKASAESARLAAEAAEQKIAAQNKIKAEAEQYEYLERVIRDYYKAQNDLISDKSGVQLDADTGKYSLESGMSSAFTDRLNRTAVAYQDIENAIKALPIEQQVKLNALIDEYVQKLREASQAKQQQSDAKDALKAEADAYEKATLDLKEYYKALTEALKFRDEIRQNDDGTWETDNKNLQAFVDRLNSATTAYKQAEEAAARLSAENKDAFSADKAKAVQAYNEAVQAQNRKDIDAGYAKKEADAKRYAAQVEKVNNLLLKTKKQLNDFAAAKTGKSSDSYRGLEQTCNVLEEMAAELRDTGHAVDDLDSRFDDASASAKKFASNIELAGENTKSIKSKLGDLMNALGFSFTYAEVFQKAIEIGRKMFETVTEVDTAMTELKKVTEEADSTYTRFLENAKSRAHGLGATVADTVSATADFARLGHTLTDATSLADAAIVYKNVGDGIEDISVASESIISTMQAFGVEAKDAMSIVDSFNNVGNNFAISSKGIGDALLNSAASLHAAGNDVHESIALIAAANTTIQDPGKVGKCLPNNAVMHCKKIAISVKGWRQLRPRKDFVVCVRRVRESTDFYYL